MEFLESPAFTRWVERNLSFDEYGQLQAFLAANPEYGDVVPGTGGFRKLRWRDPSRRKGSRGGLRIIYYFFSTGEQIWLMAIYAKGEIADITASQKDQLRRAIQHEAAARSKRTKG
jgi:hypothetical protein